MSWLVWWVLIPGSILTAAFSAVFGVAGGMMLFVLLALCLDTRSAVPLHAVVQLVSNAARVWVSWRHIDRAIVWRFVALAPLGVWLGGYCVEYAHPRLLETGIGLTILAMVYWFPKSHKEAPSFPTRHPSLWIFVPLGFVSAFLGMLVGAVGPLVSPFFLRQPLSKEGMVASKAACQFIVHLTKIPAFLLVVRFEFDDYTPLLLALCTATVAGTYIGKNLLSRFSESAYHLWEKRVLTILSLVIITKAWLGAA